MRILSTTLATLLFTLSGIHAQQSAWEWVTPYPTASPINQVLFLTQQTGILLAGETSYGYGGGSLLRTTDGGSTWSNVSPDPNLSYAAVSFIDSVRGWIAGGYSSSVRVFNTTNGGLTWGLQFAPVISFYATDIFFINQSSGWLVGEYGRIYRTQDGGVTWLNRSISQTYPPDFYGVRFTTPLDGAVVGTGYGGSSYYFAAATTTDGGDTWILRAAGMNSVLNDLSIRPPSSLITVGSGALVLQSTNGGKRWLLEMQDVTAGQIPNLYGVAFRDSLFGMAVGTNGTVLKTNDGGESWMQSTVLANAILRSVQISGNNIVVGGNVGDIYSSSSTPAILISSDAGISWSNRARYIDNSFTINAIAFITPSRFFVAGSGYMYETADSGLTWTVRRSATGSESVRDMAFLSPQTGIAVGEAGFYQGLILRTSDGGVNWTTTTISSANYLDRMSFPSPDTGYIAATSYNYTGFVLKTTNAGVTWTTLSSANAPSGYTDVKFLSPSLGWAASGRFVYKTTDGGATWTSYPTNSLYTIYRISFPTSNVGYATSSYGDIFKTTNGGLNWQSLGYIGNSVYSILFSDVNRGWLVGSGRIYATTNGGTSWTSEFSSSIGLYALTLSPSRSLWAAGSNSSVVRRTGQLTVGIEEDALKRVPTNYGLDQNYPNPFNPTTTINYRVPERSRVVLKIYNVTGQEVATLVDEVQDAASYSVTWYSRAIASGVYFYRLQAGSFVETKKMMVVK